MADLFKKFLGANPSTPRNGFDLSQRHVFSTKAGLLTPVFHLSTLSPSEYSIDVRDVLRTESIQTAAFTRMTQNLEFYQVMINDLYSGFNQYVAQTEDKQLVNTPDTDVLPHFALKNFVFVCLQYAVYDYIVSLGSIPCYQNNIYTWPDGHSWNFDQLSIEDLQPFVIEGSSDANFLMPSLVSGINGNVSVALEVLRNLDLFGYGNFLPLLHLICDMIGFVFRYWEKTKPTTLSFRSEAFKFSEFTATLSTCLAELDNTSDIGIDNFTDFILYFCDFYVPDVKLNLWYPLAFNKIYDLHYRNPYYDVNYKLYRAPSVGTEFIVNVFDYVHLFNLDDVKGELSDVWRLMAIFAPKFHPYSKDMFSGVLPSTQFGDVSVMTDTRDFLNLEVKGTDELVASGANLSVGANVGSDLPPANVEVGNFGAKFRFNPALAISILNQRRADALQRFNENKMRAGNRTHSNFVAHGWSAPKSELAHAARFLGAFDGDISLNTVAATSPNEGVSLGELGANGVSTLQGRKIQIKTDDYSVILGIYYISKPSEYDSYGIDYHNTLLDKWDYPYTELQNISLAPLDVMQLSLYRRALVGSEFGDFKGDGIIHGYLPRFIADKTAYDKDHGEFYTNNPFSYARLDKSPFDQFGVNVLLRQGLFSNYVTPRSHLENPTMLDFLYINPDSVDNIFVNLFTNAQASDQFKVNCQFDVFAVQPLSVLGLPKD